MPHELNTQLCSAVSRSISTAVGHNGCSARALVCKTKENSVGGGEKAKKSFCLKSDSAIAEEATDWIYSYDVCDSTVGSARIRISRFRAHAHTPVSFEVLRTVG